MVVTYDRKKWKKILILQIASRVFQTYLWNQFYFPVICAVSLTCQRQAKRGNLWLNISALMFCALPQRPNIPIRTPTVRPNFCPAKYIKECKLNCSLKKTRTPYPDIRHRFSAFPQLEEHSFQKKNHRSLHLHWLGTGHRIGRPLCIHSMRAWT